MYDFSGKAVVISGASRGLGRGLADELAAEGANLCLLARDGAAVREVAYELKRARGVDAFGRECDVREPARVAAAVQEAVNRLGRLDLLVCNAGILGTLAPVADTEPQAWAATVDANLNGTFNLVHHAMRAMAGHGGGRIVFVTSSVGRTVRSGWGAYCVSKFATEGLMQLIAAEGTPAGITSLSINPGGTATDMRKAAFPDEDQKSLPSPRAVARAFIRILRRPDAELNGQAFNARDFIQ